ncbi:MAG: hypothetical protein BIFFINMI_02910 [Phycisphaerae bacterium]|nr:hypothetical protein [Phycisphaerae bacterium]
MIDRDDNLNAEDLSAYLDGELSADRVVLLERRLAQDGELRHELDELAAVKRIVGELPHVKAPASLAAGVLEQLERRTLLASDAPSPSTPRNWRLFARFTAAAAALLIAASVAVIVYNHVHATGPTPGTPGPEVALNTRAPENAKDRGGQASDTRVADRTLDAAGHFKADGTPAEKEGVDEARSASEAPGPILAKGGRPEMPVGKDGRPLTPTRTDFDSKPGTSVAMNTANASSQADKARFDLAQQVASGSLDARKMEEYSFANEPIELNWPVASLTEQKQADKAVDRWLSVNSFVQVNDDGKVQELPPDTRQLALRGRAQQNFNQAATVPSQSQIVVVADRRKINELIHLSQDLSQNRARVLINVGQEQAARGLIGTEQLALRDNAAGWQALEGGAQDQAYGARQGAEEPTGQSGQAQQGQQAPAQVAPNAAPKPIDAPGKVPGGEVVAVVPSPALPETPARPAAPDNAPTTPTEPAVAPAGPAPTTPPAPSTTPSPAAGEAGHGTAPKVAPADDAQMGGGRGGPPRVMNVQVRPDAAPVTGPADTDAADKLVRRDPEGKQPGAVEDASVTGGTGRLQTTPATQPDAARSSLGQAVAGTPTGGQAGARVDDSNAEAQATAPVNGPGAQQAQAGQTGAQAVQRKAQDIADADLVSIVVNIYVASSADAPQNADIRAKAADVQTQLEQTLDRDAGATSQPAVPAKRQ